MSRTWPKVKLGEVLRQRETDVRVDPSKVYQFAGVYCFGRGVFRGQEKLGNQFAYNRLTQLRAGEFVYPKLMAWEGAFGVVPSNCDGCYVSPEFPVFQLHRDRLDVQFLSFFFQIPRTWNEVSGGSTGTNVRRRRLHPDAFLQAEIPLPPLAEQRRIVARLGELFGQIQEARTLRQKAIAESTALPMAFSLYQFSSPASDWKQLSISDACEEMIDYRGRTPPISNTGIPHITSANIKGGRINWHTSKFVTEETYFAFMTRGVPKPQDVLFTMEAPLGEVGVVPDGRRFSLAQRVILLRPRSDILFGEFLAKVLVSPAVRGEILSKATATTVSGIAAKRLKLIRIPIPPLAVQHRIVAASDALRTEVDALKNLQAETAAELDAFLPSVLSKAFAGKL